MLQLHAHIKFTIANNVLYVFYVKKRLIHEIVFHSKVKWYSSSINVPLVLK